MAEIRPAIIPKGLPERSLKGLETNQKIESSRVVDVCLRAVAANAVSFEGMVLESTEISSCKLRKASLSDVVFQDCLLFGSDFDGSGWLRVEVNKGMHSGMVVTDCNFQDVKFASAKLNLVNFRSSKLKRVLFQDCDMTEVDFQGANLSDVKFENCDLSRAEFSGATFSKVDLRGSEISTVKGVSSMRGVRIGTSQLISIAGALAAEMGLAVDD